MGARGRLICNWLAVLLVAAASSHAPLLAAAQPQQKGTNLCDASAGHSSILVTEHCTWGSAVAAGSSLSILGFRASAAGAATPVVTSGAGVAAGSTTSKTGVRLELQRLVLVGFQIAAPDADQPVLWPAGLTTGHGIVLNMTDVRVVISSQELFSKYLDFFTKQNTLMWTDNTNFIHIHQWGDARTQLRSVGVLMQAAAAGGPGDRSRAAAAALQVKNCLPLATNTTLLPALLSQAAVATQVPLLMYLTSNVTIGQHPVLPANGLLIQRPVVFVGLQSQLTSIDFEMVVNQLNLSTSAHANSTFVGVVLENLAPGDTVTSAVASPFSIAITNNVWAVYYNRSRPQQVRWVLNNVTLVLPQDSEMSYVTYMFTLFNSPLQYLKEQTKFYTDVLHMAMLQFTPGPGTHAITVNHLLSWFHRWGNVVLTTQPAVALPLPLPQRPLVLTTATRASPLVQAVRTTEELQAYSEQPVLGDREHILLFLANVSLPVLAPPPASSSSNSANDSAVRPIQLASSMLWLGYKPGARQRTVYALRDATQPAAAATEAGRQDGDGEASAARASGSSSDSDERVHLDCQFQRFGVEIPAERKDWLQLQQLVLSHLPQGPGAAVPTTALRAMPSSLFTVLMWSFRRGVGGSHALRVTGVTMLVPQPELDYFSAYASSTNNFVVEITGELGQTAAEATRGDAITFENAYMQGSELHVKSMTGPGLIATNVTLRGDPGAVAAMPGGHIWPDISQLRVPAAPSGHPPWVSAVIAVAVTLAVVLLALGAFVWWQRKRICVQDPEGQLYALDGSGLSKTTSRSSCAAHTPGVGCSRQGSTGLDNGGGSSNLCTGVCSSSAPCTVCARTMHNMRRSGSSSTDVHMPLAESAGVKQSPRSTAAGRNKHAGANGGLLAAAAAGVLGAAAASGGAGAAARAPRTPGGQGPSSPPVSDERDTVGERDYALREREAAALGVSSSGAETSSSLQDNVAAGMQRWRAAVSSTTMLLMERRMDAAAGLPSGDAASSSAARSSAGVAGAALSTSPLGPQDTAVQQPSEAAAAGGAGAAAAAGSALAASGGSASAQQQQQLQLLELLGQGSFGSVFVALWRGKKIAVKVMQLPASALLEPGQQLPGSNLNNNQQQQPSEQQAGQQQDDGVQEQRRRLQQQKQHNSPPHMAIMEAVVSSTMSHPNVVTVYSYMLSPLTSTNTEGGMSSDNQPVAGGSSNGQDIAGWSLKLLMELCEEGSLRDALDCGLLSKPGGFLAPSAVLSLAHDVAAAMLHLHSEGIVHGDLKAGNVMLTSCGNSSAGGVSGVRIWSASGDQRSLTAKVADFGLAFPLGPRDTHATLLARGTPTHMSPELFISGHVSKASDVFAFGVLLYEIMTGRRAYAGVPIPLLPHEVARGGLRPEWPQGLPPGCRDLRKLAEACWAQKPQDRPTFADILSTLDVWAAGGHGWPAVPPGNRTIKPRQQQQQADEQQQQQQAPPAAPPDQQQQQEGQQQQQQPSSPDQQQQQQQLQEGAPPVGLQSQQQQQPSVLPTTSGRTAGEAGRNMRHMSWSEVNME